VDLPNKNLHFKYGSLRPCINLAWVFSVLGYLWLDRHFGVSLVCLLCISVHL